MPGHCGHDFPDLDKPSYQYLWVVPNPGGTGSDGGSIRVLVADDHPVYLDGLAAAIERTGDLELLGTCTNGAEALERIRAESPDVAVLDLRMPRLGAAEVLQELAAEETPCRVLVLSFHVGGEAGARVPESRRCRLRRQGRRPR